MGFSLDELLGLPVKAKGGRKAVNEAKYRHPENRSLTWSGRVGSQSGSLTLLKAEPRLRAC